MSKIKTIYLISHTHTDIGYTDYQDTVFRQLLGFIDKAVELGEATADYPPEARYKWTCEVSSFVERYFRERPARQVDRFLELHRRGQMAVAGMAYHWTPLLSTANMIRSLYPMMRLRRDYGLKIESAMQCDVDGASWLWADVLPAAGIKGFTMSINMYRGRRPEPDLNPFWWEGPGGGRLLSYNGPHYLYGIFRYGIGDWQKVEELLPPQLEKLEKRDDYPFDYLYAQVTHAARVDNGPPTDNLSDFVRDWNAQGRTPRMEFVTVDDFINMLHARYADKLFTWKGDWADWWADGPASSSYETALNRSTEELLPLVDLLSTQVDVLDDKLIEEAYNAVALYDEHTWGGFASTRQPHSAFTRAIFNHKSGYAYRGYGLTHELLAEGGRALVRKTTGVVPEGEKWRRWGQYVSSDPSSDPGAHRFLVVNPLSWTRRVRYPLPPDIGGAAPYAVLEMFLVDNYREGSPLATKGAASMMVDATLPPFGYQVVDYSEVTAGQDMWAGDGVIENQWYRVRVDAQTGGLASWYDKELGRELVNQDSPWRLGQYIYEWIDSPADRLTMFSFNYYDENFGDRFTDTPFRRQGPSRVEVMPARVEPSRAVVEVRIAGPGIKSGRVRYSLPGHEKALHLDFVLDKEFRTLAEAVYIPFPIAFDQPKFHLDLNGVPLEPEAEQLPGSCRDWYGIHRWAEVGDGEVSVVLAPLDAPLVQVGGITTSRWAWHLDTRAATLVSWALQNHWDTNFKGSQGEELLFRYRLTSRPGYDAAASSRFAMEMAVPPLIVRAAGADASLNGQFLQVSPEGVAEVQIKRAIDGRGVIIHASNLSEAAQELSLSFPAVHLAGAWGCSAIEEDGDALPIAGDTVTLALAARSVAFARVTFAS
ncbi:MAG: hypothetical protein K1X65_09695 [Caldilineales bacterium]|nr:hypothetical protein [Caldilineales bacterium]